MATVEGAQAAYDSVAELRRENLQGSLALAAGPADAKMFVSCTPRLYDCTPKVSVFVEATDRTVNVIEERFDIAIRAKPVIDDVARLVAKTLGNSQRVLVVSPAFLDQYGHPENPADLPKFNTVASTDDIFDTDCSPLCRRRPSFANP